MKYIQRIVLAATLLIAPLAFGQDKVKPKGYDLGACSQNGFVAAHILYVGKDLKMDLVSKKQDSVEKLDNPIVYKFQSKDEKGSHFLYVSPKNNKVEFVFDFENNIGLFLVDGKPQAIIFLMKDDDGSKLAENAMSEYKACGEMFGSSNEN